MNRCPHALHRSLTVALAASTLVAACERAPSDGAPVEVTTNLAALVQTIDGVAFFPPLGDTTPSTTGSYDSGLTEGLSILLERSAGNTYETVATFTAHTSPAILRLDDFRVYMCDVPAAQYLTDASRAYRFRVLYQDGEIGRTDLSSYVFTVLQTVPALTIGVKLHIDLRPAPVLASISPSRWGADGNELTLTVLGASFLSDSVVRLGGTALATTFVSSSELHATVPTALIPTAGTQDVTVYSRAPGGGTSSAATLSLDNPLAYASFTAPTRVTAGAGDLTLTVYGAPFVPGATVTFGGHPVEATFISTTTMTALIPAALLATAGTYAVAVTNPGPGGGTSGSATFTVDEYFTPTPSLTALAPGSVNVGAAAFTLTVTGTSFLPGAQVTFGATALATTYVSPTTLTALVPASAVTTGGVTVNVTATNPAPTRGASSPLVFSILAPIPTLTSVSPSSGLVNNGPTTLTLDGASFIPGTVASFNGTALATTYVSSTRVTAVLTAVAAAPVGNASITVSSDGGAHSSGPVTFVVGARGVSPQIAVGDFHTCALHSDGTVWCSGYNSDGQLGDGTTTDRERAVKVTGISTATQVSTGSYASCARLSDSTVWCWGSNSGGNLGNNNSSMYQSSTPVQVFGITATEVSVGHYYACARRSTGAVVCWGMNFSGQVGNGTTFDSYRPTLVTGVSNATHVITGRTHACALIADGTARCWGANNSGQLGNGTTTGSPSAVTVTGLTGATQLGAYWDSTCALLNDRTVHCWGEGAWGSLGTGTTTSRSTVGPAVTGLTNVTLLGGGGLTPCALLTDNTVRCWGDNRYGNLAIGTVGGQSNTPVTPIGLGVTTGLCSGLGQRFSATQSNGTVLMTGSGYLGALGDGDASYHTTGTPFVGAF